MVGYAIGSFFGMMAISTAYAFIYTMITKALSKKISQAWAHRPARFIILILFAVQGIACLVMHLFSWYLLYLGATYVSHTDTYGYEYTGEDKITTAWLFFGVSMAMSFISDILKGIFVLTFAD